MTIIGERLVETEVQVAVAAPEKTQHIIGLGPPPQEEPRVGLSGLAKALADPTPIPTNR